MGWSPEDAAVEAGEGEAAPEVLGEVMGEEEIAMEEGVTGEVVGAETVPEPEGRLSEQQPGEDVGAETVPEPGGRLPEQQPGDWLSLENGRRGAVQVVGNVVQGSGVDSNPALARGCLPAGVCCAWRVTLLSDDYYYVGVATSEVSLSGWLGGNGDVRSIYLRDDKKGTRAVTRPQYRKEECGPRLKAGNFIDFSYDGRRSLTAICRDAMGKVVGDHRFELGRGPYFIALAGNLQLGDNATAVHYGASFTRVWTLGCDAACLANEGPVSIWRPDITAPYVFFGDSVVLKGSAPHHCHVTMRDDEVDTVPPVGFRRVADQQGGGAVYIWEPVPPSPDYVALGDVATLSAQEPDPAKDFPRLRCAARRLTQVTPLRAHHFHCRAPPGRLGLAFTDSTRFVARVNATSALFDTVRKGDELVSVNDCVVADDDVIGVLTAQDDGATARALVFSRYDCKIWADTGIGFESTPDFAFFSAPTGGLFVAMAPGRPVQGDRRHSQPAGPFSHLIGSVEYFSPISDAARRRDGVKDACTAVFRVLCMAVLCVVCGGGGASGGAHR